MMKPKAVLLLLALLAAAGLGGKAFAQARNATKQAASPDREVAVTFDDLPLLMLGEGTDEEKRQLAEKLIHKISAQDVPATGFVVGERIKSQTERTILKEWLDAGLRLGSHSYTHASLFDKSLAEYKKQVERTEKAVHAALSPRGNQQRRMHFFRHPYLNTGRTLEQKEAFERFLARRGYRVAPVTIDNSDFMFDKAYAKAAAREDSTLMKRIGRSYIDYMEKMFAFYERRTMRFLGRQIPQVLLLHANRLNAHYFGELAAMMRDRQYSFISLPEALEDPAYDLPDRYVSEYRIRGGISWIERWRVTATGDERQEHPEAPEWVAEIAYPDS